MSYESAPNDVKALSAETYERLTTTVDELMRVRGEALPDRADLIRASFSPDEAELLEMGYAPGEEGAEPPVLSIIALRSGAASGDMLLRFAGFRILHPSGYYLPANAEDIVIEPNGRACSTRPDISRGEGDGALGYEVVTPFTEDEALRLTAYLERAAGAETQR